MAREATVTTGLLINYGTQQYQNRPGQFFVTMTERSGPTPGQITVPLAGVDVDLSELETPGLCWIYNLDSSNYVEYGIREPENSRFYPLGEIGPGEGYVIKLSRNIRQEYQGTGTGTSAPTNALHLKANTAPCKVKVEAHGK